MATELEAAGEVAEVQPQPHPGLGRHSPVPPFTNTALRGHWHISDHCGQNITLLVLTSHHFICQDNFKCHGWIPLNLNYSYIEIVFNSLVSSVKSLLLNINIDMTGKY